MHSYDAVLVVGSKPDEKTWKFPSHIYAALDAAQALVMDGKARYIIVSGKWAIKFDWIGTTQSFRECDAMADYLIAARVAPDKILREGISKDTISNFFYVKTELLIPNQLKSLLIISADWRLPRLRLLSQRILGSEYSVDFQGVAFKANEVNPDEARITQTQLDFLRPMKDGDHEWLRDKFYTGALYNYWKNFARQS